MIAIAYALMNALLLIAAAAGFARRTVPLQGVLLAYVAMRCMLLMMIANAEPRYTLEAFPMLFAAAAMALSRPDLTSKEAQSL